MPSVLISALRCYSALYRPVSTMNGHVMEAQLVADRNVLLALSEGELANQLAGDFFGSVIRAEREFMEMDLSSKSVYVCGTGTLADSIVQALRKAGRVLIIAETSSFGELLESSCDEDETVAWPLVGVGRVPLRVHGAGVLYRRFFDPSERYFDRIQGEHEFQHLTESNKPGRAHRTGIYLTPVVQDAEGNRHFRLLRCSTNLSGPTDNFRSADTAIVDALNQEASYVFENFAPLNHVLAQIYWNTAATATEKMKKAKIAPHADKTKDMPPNGVMAFCTFYSQLEEKLKPSSDDPFDWMYHGKSVTAKSSGLTTLRFRLKKVVEESGCGLTKEFSVPLYPESVFFMSLSTNRLYTHEIRPAALTPEQMPTRLGYVVRCSKSEALYKDGQTWFKMPRKGEDGSDQVELVPMAERTAEGVAELRRMYKEENALATFIDYGERFLFSMNDGDYQEPIYQKSDEFRRYDMPFGDECNPFEELLASVRFEGVCNGRQGTTLVHRGARGVPIVRTTTRYEDAAPCFEAVHTRLARRIREVASLPFELNNGLIEVYDNSYAKMGYHSDQAQDLAPGSHIALFSCYKDPAVQSRKLVVESKENSGSRFEVPLEHNSVVVWSLDTNRRFIHKIVLDQSRGTPPENNWLGVTFRTSKTFVHVSNGECTLEDGTKLHLATDEEKKMYYKLRGRENKETAFEWPVLDFTISPSDLLPPVKGLPARDGSPAGDDT